MEKLTDSSLTYMIWNVNSKEVVTEVRLENYLELSLYTFKFFLLKIYCALVSSWNQGVHEAI